MSRAGKYLALFFGVRCRTPLWIVTGCSRGSGLFRKGWPRFRQLARTAGRAMIGSSQHKEELSNMPHNDHGLVRQSTARGAQSYVKNLRIFEGLE